MGSQEARKEKSCRNISSDIWRKRDEVRTSEWWKLHTVLVLPLLRGAFRSYCLSVILRTALWGWIPMMCVGHLYRGDPAPKTPRLSPRSEEGSVVLLSLGCCLQCFPWGYSFLPCQGHPRRPSFYHRLLENLKMGPEGEHEWEKGREEDWRDCLLLKPIPTSAVDGGGSTVQMRLEINIILSNFSRSHEGKLPHLSLIGGA